MPLYISMLRGVNVGGHHKIKMEDLRALYESLGYQNPRSFIQSGNVLFRTKDRNGEAISRRISDAIERKVGFRPEVLLRTASELREVIAKNPFASRRNIEPSKLAITFLAVRLDAERHGKLLAIDCAPEELRVHNRELYIYFPNGMARPKLSMSMVERILRTPCTGRNLNSVQRLLELAKAMESTS